MLHLLDSKLELLEEKRLRQAIKKYADFLSVRILLQGNQVNECTPPWEADDGKADLQEYVQSRWGLFPLGLIPFNTAETKTKDGHPLPSVSGLLFVPIIPFELARDFGEVDVYISRMFIKANDKELLPRWARFVKGVINTSELTPTLSRGEIITDEAYRRVQGLLGAIIIGYLRMLQEQDVEKLKLLVGAYNNTIKARALEDDDFFDSICDLVRVNTDLGNITIQEYLEKSGNVIYYFAERGSGTQHKLLFSHKGLPVIDASWGQEEEFLEAYAERKGVQIERLAADSGKICTVPETVDEKWKTLELAFRQRIKKEARAVEFEPESVPAVLVARPLDREDKELASIDAIGAQIGISSDAIKQMFRKMAKSKSLRASESDTILQLNIKNPLINQLRDMPRSETFDLALACIYNNAMMFAHHYVSAENAELIFAANNRAFSAMIANAQALAEQREALAKVEMERDEMKRRIGDIALSEDRSCFFAYPYDDRFHAVKDEVQRVLRRTHGVKVLVASTDLVDADAVRNIEKQIAAAHFGIADITGNNPNVMWELGVMIGLRKPVILLKDKTDGERTPFDLYSRIRVNYQAVADDATGRREFALLESGLESSMKLVASQCPDLAKAKAWEG